MTIVVLGGGLSHERDISLRSARRVVLALRDKGEHVVESDVNSDLIHVLQGMDAPVVIPMLHGGLGENGSLREVLDLLEVPYIGSAGAASRLAFDKSISTPLVAAAGVSTPKQVSLPHDVFRELGANTLIAALGTQIGFPMIVKPATGGSALGCSKVTTSAELPAAMVSAYAYGDVAVIEEFIAGTEIAITVLALDDVPQALPAVEIHPRGDVYDYEARYNPGQTNFITPSALPSEVGAAASNAALTVFRTLGLRDIARIDLIVSEGVPFFIEADVAPGMTDTSLAPLAMAAAGLEMGDVFSTLVGHYSSR